MQEMNVDPDGRFTLTGRLKYRYGEKIDLPDHIKTIVYFIEAMAKAYSKYMASDGKLVGQEKANLKKYIRELLKSILILRLYLSKEYLDDMYPESQELETGFSYSLVLDEADFTLSGNINPREFNRYKTFKQWLEESVLPLLKEFGNEIRATLKDGVLTKEEVTWLNKTLDKMLHTLLLMDYRITHYSMRS
ncbi:MAG: hypothetical protein D6767_08070 [Candidatus Hydrogenedentota bacterium]|nr:MAG: hypothetical protein D6767_08070 [Candidatus Hydrogenedentota bacterium]